LQAGPIPSSFAVATLVALLCTSAMAAPIKKAGVSTPKKRAPQSIILTRIPVQAGISTVQLNARASSGLAVNLFTPTFTTCTVADSVITLHAAGACVIRANQAGNGAYAPALVVTLFLKIDAVRGNAELFDIAQPGKTFSESASAPPAARTSSACPFPTVASVTPNIWVSGSTYQVVVKGTGFTTPSGATRACPIPWFTAQSDSAGTTLRNTTILNSTTVIGTVTAATDGREMAANIIVWYPPPQDVEEPAPALPPKN
jgi:hypothetical protein